MVSGLGFNWSQVYMCGVITSVSALCLLPVNSEDDAQNQCFVSWSFPHPSRSFGEQRIGGIWRRSQIIHFSLHALDWMWSLRCIQSARISPDCPYLCLLGSYVTNSYVPMGFQMFVGGVGAQKCFKNERLSKNIIFKPKSLHKTLGFDRCLWADLNGNFFHIFLQIPY